VTVQRNGVVGGERRQSNLSRGAYVWVWEEGSFLGPGEKGQRLKVQTANDYSGRNKPEKCRGRVRTRVEGGGVGFGGWGFCFWGGLGVLGLGGGVWGEVEGGGVGGVLVFGGWGGVGWWFGVCFWGGVFLLVCGHFAWEDLRDVGKGRLGSGRGGGS